jgi:hypothetical protein
MLKLKARRDFSAGRFFKKSMGAEKSMGDPSTEGKSRERLWGQVLKYKKLTFQDLTPATLGNAWMGYESDGVQVYGNDCFLGIDEV